MHYLSIYSSARTVAPTIMDERTKQILEDAQRVEETKKQARAVKAAQEHKSVMLGNIVGRFNGLAPDPFVTSIGRGDLWGIPDDLRPQWNEWRTDFCMNIGKALCEAGWDGAVLALPAHSEDIGRDVAVAIMQAAVKGERDVVLSIYSSMPSGDDADSLRVRTTIWMYQKMQRELEKPIADELAPTIQPIVHATAAIRPAWDRQQKILSCGGVVVKRFAKFAANQFLVLDSFQELGWPPEIDDPHSTKADLNSTPSDRLRDTVKSLNAGRENELLVFTSLGKRLGWQLVS